MKKVILLLLLAGLEASIYSCNLCFGHPIQRFRKSGYEKVECNCNCFQQHRDDQNICAQCGHKVMPYSLSPTATATNSNAFKNSKLVRFSQKAAQKQNIKSKVVLIDQS